MHSWQENIEVDVSVLYAYPPTHPKISNNADPAVQSVFLHVHS